MKIDSGDTIYKENEPVNYFFIIADGKATVSKSSSTEKRELGPGSCFGLPLVYFNSKSRVTIKAETAIQCLYMEKATVQDVISPILREMECISQAYHDFIQSV